MKQIAITRPELYGIIRDAFVNNEDGLKGIEQITLGVGISRKLNKIAHDEPIYRIDGKVAIGGDGQPMMRKVMNEAPQILLLETAEYSFLFKAFEHMSWRADRVEDVAEAHALLKTAEEFSPDINDQGISKATLVK